VWLDALTNYITAVGYPDESSATFKKWWPADVHIIGKDIVRFHTVYWPAFLMSAGIPLPKRVFGHGFLNIKGQKMSKSVGNVLAPAGMKAEFGLDPMRYFLMREVPYGSDGDISTDVIVHRINGDLANDLGNLAQRVLSFVAKNAGAVVPAPGAFTPEDEALLKAARDALPAIRAEMENFAIHRMLEAIWRVVGDANRYVDKQAPWSLRKTDPARMATVLYVCIEVIRQVAIYVQPVMPGSGAKLLDQLGVPAEKRSFADIASAIAPGTKLPAPVGVFPRYTPPEVTAANA
jgi:methionyl-tRNA synthetase